MGLFKHKCPERDFVVQRSLGCLPKSREHNPSTSSETGQRNRPKVVVSINLLLYQIPDREQEHLALMLGLNINGLLVESVSLNVDVSSIST